MSTYLPKDVLSGLENARRADKKRKARLRVEFDGDMYPVVRMWHDGFALDAENAPHLRGFVDIYDGANHLSQCLIVASNQEDGELQFEFKRNTAATETAPWDFVRPDGAPIGFIGYDPN
jgi:hypothetical protein